MSNQLAVLILTYNEEQNIRECMESANFADEIIVVDSGSTDNTQEIAASLGAQVKVHPMDAGFAGQRNFALEQTSADWVLFLDADERIMPELALEVRTAINQPQAFAYDILRRNVVFGQRVNHGGHSPDYSLRLYPRAAIHWEGMVHEQAHVSLSVRRLQNYMLHHTYTDWDRYFFKLNQYTTLMAKQMREKGKKAGFTDIVIRPGFAFFRFYILKSGWLDGRIGFILAAFHSFYTMAKYVKLYYLQKKE